MIRKGISIHIGVNQLNPDIYETTATLAGCANDAYAMVGIACSKGYTHTRLLIDKDATRSNFFLAMEKAITELESDDILFLTYSGHGGQVQSRVAQGQMDEVWLLHDGIVVDNELCSLWTRFRPGVRIVVFSDSCHSGGIVRMDDDGKLEFLARQGAQGSTREIHDIIFPGDRVPGTFDAFYPSCKNGTLVQAHVRLIAACEDQERTPDGLVHGAFTATFLKIWAGGAFAGTYHDLTKAFKDRFGRQAPQHVFVGSPNNHFDAQIPFSI